MKVTKRKRGGEGEKQSKRARKNLEEACRLFHALRAVKAHLDAAVGSVSERTLSQLVSSAAFFKFYFLPLRHRDALNNVAVRRGLRTARRDRAERKKKKRNDKEKRASRSLVCVTFLPRSRIVIGACLLRLSTCFVFFCVCVPSSQF